MPDIQSLPFEIFVLGLRIAFIVLLYLFLFMVMRTVVRDLRSPADTGRLIYDPPVHLSERTAAAAGARQMWAPFGIATPDTVAPRATTIR